MKWYITVLKKYADFNGRAKRSEYWYFMLFNTIISIVISLTDEALNSKILGLVYNLAVIIPSIAVGVRRMHDVGKSGWFCLIPIYNFILACTDGDHGPNKYGADPKRPELMDEIDILGSDLNG
jgi:uncharacterized membrane protein YhaH (DUF805 family)